MSVLLLPQKKLIDKRIEKEYQRHSQLVSFEQCLNQK
jgi:hypothetical protein